MCSVNHSKVIYIFISTALVTACNSFTNLTVKYDKETDFDQFKTYAWLMDADRSGNNDFDNDFIRQRIRNYIGHCLKERQYAIDTLEPDLLVRVKWMAEARQLAMPDVTDRPFYYDRIYYDDPYAPRLSLRISKPSQLIYPNRFRITEGKQTYYHNGVEVIFVDSRTKEVVWNGFTSDDIYDPKTIDKELHPSIHVMMKKFPLKK